MTLININERLVSDFSKMYHKGLGPTSTTSSTYHKLQLVCPNIYI